MQTLYKQTTVFSSYDRDVAHFRNPRRAGPVLEMVFTFHLSVRVVRVILIHNLRSATSVATKKVVVHGYYFEGNGKRVVTTWEEKNKTVVKITVPIPPVTCFDSPLLRLL